MFSNKTPSKRRNFEEISGEYKFHEVATMKKKKYPLFTHIDRCNAYRPLLILRD